jgi:hypothetical protein
MQAIRLMASLLNAKSKSVHFGAEMIASIRAATASVSNCRATEAATHWVFVVPDQPLPEPPLWCGSFGRSPGWHRKATPFLL